MSIPLQIKRARDNKKIEADKKLCTCLFDTIIHEDSACVFDDVVKEKKKLFRKQKVKFVKYYGATDLKINDKLRDVVADKIREEYLDEEEDDAEWEIENSCVDDYYERLVLLTNDNKIFPFEGKVVFSRIFRVITKNRIHDFNKLFKDHEISVWSNGNNDFRYSKFLIYYEGQFVKEMPCPPLIPDVIGYVISNLQLNLDIESKNYTIEE